MAAAYLECSLDATHRFETDRLWSTCTRDGAPLLVRYAPFVLERATAAARPFSMWRYREALPVERRRGTDITG